MSSLFTSEIGVFIESVSIAAFAVFAPFNDLDADSCFLCIWLVQSVYFRICTLLCFGPLDHFVDAAPRHMSIHAMCGGNSCC